MISCLYIICKRQNPSVVLSYKQKIEFCDHTKTNPKLQVIHSIFLPRITFPPKYVHLYDNTIINIRKHYLPSLYTRIQSFLALYQSIFLVLLLNSPLNFYFPSSTNLHTFSTSRTIFSCNFQLFSSFNHHKFSCTEHTTLLTSSFLYSSISWPLTLPSPSQ